MKLKIPKLTEKQILDKLKDREYEDLELLKDLEKNILRRRDYIVSSPKEGENVLLLLSGGLDSVVVWGVLLKHFRCNVYPFYSFNGLDIGEILSILFYSRKFRNFNGYNKPFIHKLNPKIFKLKKAVEQVSPEIVLKYYAPKIGNVLHPTSGSNYLSVLNAGYYAMNLWWQKGIEVNKIISGVTAKDGIEIYTQTQTFSRQLMLTLMLSLKKNNFEYYALGLEKNLGFFLEKQDFIKLARSLDINLALTHSCSKKTWINCGACFSCLDRKNTFLKLKYKDETFYLSDCFLKILTLKIKPSILKWYKLIRRQMKKYFKPLVKRVRITASARERR